MLQILGRSSSINVRKVLWTCVELGLAYEQEEWGTESLPASTPEFRALNPNALVPVIRDGSFVLWESNAICRYLASKHGRADLLPTEVHRRALVEQWMDWQATELNNAWRYAFMARVRLSAEHRDLASIAASVRTWNRHMTIVDAQLERTGAFITGSGFTLADIVLGLSVNRWLLTPLERPSLPRVAAYHDRLSARAGCLMHGRNGTP
jgi:glutathione S-transferase